MVYGWISDYYKIKLLTLNIILKLDFSIDGRNSVQQNWLFTFSCFSLSSNQQLPIQNNWNEMLLLFLLLLFSLLLSCCRCCFFYKSRSIEMKKNPSKSAICSKRVSKHDLIHVPRYSDAKQWIKIDATWMWK